MKNVLAAAAFVGLFIAAVDLPAQGPQNPAPQGGAQQTPPAGPGAQGGRGRGGGRATFPAQQRPPGDPALIERGSTLYGIYCRACHGPDLRGGDQGGPNLLRSQLVLNDQDGELILPVVQGGRQTPGMPMMPPQNLPPDDVKAIAAFIHSVTARGGGQGSPPSGAPVELDIVVGDAAAGQAYFTAKCASCHSPTGDLKGIASRVTDPRVLQNLWVSGGGGGGRGGRGRGQPAPESVARPTTVTVTLPSGQKIEGPLVRWDDFLVTLTGPDGFPRTIRRDGDVPKVEFHDPQEPHKKLLPLYTDKDIHDVTAYLVTLK